MCVCVRGIRAKQPDVERTSGLEGMGIREEGKGTGLELGRLGTLLYCLSQHGGCFLRRRFVRHSLLHKMLGIFSTKSAKKQLSVAWPNISDQ